jgi:hypothetical protein
MFLGESRRQYVYLLKGHSQEKRQSYKLLSEGPAGESPFLLWELGAKSIGSQGMHL